MSRQLQLTYTSDYDPSKLIFEEPVTMTQPVQYKRVPISYRLSNGKKSDLLIPTERLFSLGVWENTDLNTGAVNGYSLPLCLLDRENPTKEQKQWYETFQQIVDQCRQYLVDNQTSLLKKRNKELRDFEDISSSSLTFRKDPKTQIEDETSPTLLVKFVIPKSQKSSYKSQFYDVQGNALEPSQMVKKYGFARAVIRVESLYIGTAPKLQIKLWEACYEPLETGMQRLLPLAPKPVEKMETIPEENEEGSLSGGESASESESEESIPPPKSGRGRKRKQ